MDSKTAIEILTDETITLVGGKYRLKAMDIPVAKEIAALIEQQAQEIERLNQTWPNSCDFKDDDGCCLFPGAMTPECHADACSVIKGLKQEIERLNKSLQYEQHRTGRQGTHAEGCYKWGPGHWDCAMREIAKRGRMLNRACKRLSMTNMSIRTEKQWLAWLEKEAEVGLK